MDRGAWQEPYTIGSQRVEHTQTYLSQNHSPELFSLFFSLFSLSDCIFKNIIYSQIKPLFKTQDLISYYYIKVHLIIRC